MNLTARLRDDALDVIGSFIRDRVGLAGADGVVLGLSGGLDSVLATVLCAQVLGPERVRAVHMPIGPSGGADEDQSRELCANLGVPFEVRSIGRPLDGFQSMWKRLPPHHMGNVAARTRMVVLFTEAALGNRLVMGTSNKSELMTGYFTKYGDGAADLMPLGDLYKTQVRALAERVGVPAHFIAKAPSAGLVPGQTDEADLGVSYDMLDRILIGYELELSPSEIADRAKAPKKTVDMVLSKVASSRHKRALPPIPKLGVRTVGLDMREEYAGRR